MPNPFCLKCSNADPSKFLFVVYDDNPVQFHTIQECEICFMKKVDEGSIKIKPLKKLYSPNSIFRKIKVVINK